jgi:Transposase DDE domain
MTAILSCWSGEEWLTTSIGHAPRAIQAVYRPSGGQTTGSNPTGRGQSGSTRHLVVDRRGVPLAIRQTAANVHDAQLLETMIDAIPALLRPRGRPRKRPHTLPADKGYDDPRCHRVLKPRHIIARMARQGITSSERWERYRWLVGRTLSWLNR